MKVNTYKVSNIYTKSSDFQGHAPLTVTVPGSKSITNRALLLATLAQGTTTLHAGRFAPQGRSMAVCRQCRYGRPFSLCLFRHFRRYLPHGRF